MAVNQTGCSYNHTSMAPSTEQHLQ